LMPKPLPSIFIATAIKIAFNTKLLGPTGKLVAKNIKDDKPINPPPTILEGMINPTHPMELPPMLR